MDDRDNKPRDASFRANGLVSRPRCDQPFCYRHELRAARKLCILGARRIPGAQRNKIGHGKFLESPCPLNQKAARIRGGFTSLDCNDKVRLDVFLEYLSFVRHPNFERRFHFDGCRMHNPSCAAAAHTAAHELSADHCELSQPGKQI